MVERMYSYFLSLIKYTFIPEKGGKRQPNSIVLKNIEHVMMISINHAWIYLGLRASPSMCSRSLSLWRNGGLALCRQLRSVCSHSCPTCQWYAKRKCIDRLAIRVLGFAPSYYSSLRHSLQGVLHYDAFLSMHFHHQRDFRHVWFNAQLIRAW